MAQSDPDERLVYLACQHIFRGSHSQVRKQKNVQSLIRQNEPALADILREYNINRICKVAKKLLEDQVFGSTYKAKIRFPELFDVSPTQSAEREASEAEAARDEANAVREISDGEASREASRKVTIISHAQPDNKDREHDASPSERNLGTSKAAPSLYPVYIQYRTQHLVTTSIQNLLEQSCFVFAQHYFPQLLAKNGWDCPEAVELTEWTKIFSQHPAQLTTAIKKATRKPPHEIFDLLRELRHSAVHRLQKTAIGIERLAENAQLFLEVLNDSVHSEKVSRLRQELRMAIEELKRNKDLLEGRLLAQIKDINAKRAELDMWEQDAKNCMVNDDLQCLNDVSEGLEKSLREVNSDERNEAKGKGKMAAVCPESSDSDEEFLDAAVEVDSSDV